MLGLDDRCSGSSSSIAARVAFDSLATAVEAHDERQVRRAAYTARAAELLNRLIGNGARAYSLPAT
jgi:hypothetical protein